MFTVVVSKHAARVLAAVPPKTRERLLTKVEALGGNPFQGKRLHGELDGLLSLRSGPWRIVYEADSKTQTVIVHGIGPRGDVYKG